MKRKVFKMATVFAAIAALGVGMAGCSVNTKTSGSSDDSAKESTSAGDEKVITMWHIQTQDAVAKTIEDSMKRFEEDNPGYNAHVR